MVMIISGFCYFVFLKIFTALCFDHGLSLVGALISTVVILGLELIIAMQFRKILEFAQFHDSVGHPSNISTKKLWLSWIAVLPLMTGALILVSIGFSSRFYDRVLEGSYREFLDWDNVFILFLGVVIMTLPQIVMTHLGLKAIAAGKFKVGELN